MTRDPRSTRSRTRLTAGPALALAPLALAGALAWAPAAAADAAQTLRIRSLAATCAHCHGTEGRAIEGEAMFRLAGQDQNYILTQLLAFRTGSRPATIMHQITRGYSQEQLEALAQYFSQVK